MSNRLKKPIKAGTVMYGVSYCGKPDRHAREAFEFMAHRRGYRGSFAVADGMAIVWLYDSYTHAEKALKKAISVGMGVYENISSYVMQDNGHLRPSIDMTKAIVSTSVVEESEVDNAEA